VDFNPLVMASVPLPAPTSSIKHYSALTCDLGRATGEFTMFGAACPTPRKPA